MKFSPTFTSKVFRRSFITAAAVLFAAPLAAQAELLVNYPDGSECQTLIAGQHIEAGEVCVEVEEPNLVVTYNMLGDWELMEAHLWAGTDLLNMPANKKGNPKIGNFPYVTGDITGAPDYTFYVPLEDAFGSVEPCGVTGLLAGHAAVQRDNGDGGYETQTGWIDGEQIIEKGSWAMFSSVDFTCPPPPEPVRVPDMGMTCSDDSETAFALGEKTLIEIGATESRWGWQMEIDDGENRAVEIYAGAGQNDVSKGTLVGYLLVERDGDQVTVSYDMSEGFGMTQTHLYVGDKSIEEALGTAAPGKYGLQHELDCAGSDSYTVTVSTDGTVYVVAHAVVSTKE